MKDLRIQQGWQCPICNYVYNPLTPQCFNCNRDYSEKYKVTDGTQYIDTHMCISTSTDGRCNTCGRKILL